MASKQTGSIDMNTYAEAAGKATHYVAEQASGIFVHPEDDMSNGVSIQDTIEIIRDGDSVAEFGEEIRLGKEGESAQANFSAAGMQFKNENGDVIAKMLSTEASIGTIDTEESFTTYILDWPTNITTLVDTSYKFANIEFSTSDNFIHYSIYLTKFAIFDTRDTNHDGSYPWYHLDNNGTVNTVQIGQNGAMSQSHIFGTIAYPDTIRRIRDNVTLVKDEIVNGQRTYTNIQTVYIDYVLTFSAENKSLALYITITGLPSTISSSSYVISGWGFGNMNRGSAQTTIVHQAVAGYAPEYVFGLKKAGQDPQAYAFIAGEQNYANAQHQAIFGKFNDPDSNHAFEIGNGTDDENRSNAFAVDWNGNVKANNLVTNVAYNSTTKALTKTINDTTSNIVTLSTLATALTDLMEGLVNKGTITSLDDTTDVGYYTFASNATGSPLASASGALLVFRRTSAYVTQIVSSSSNSTTAAPIIYIRRSYNGTWAPWYRVNLRSQDARTYSTPTITSSRCTISNGGYYQENGRAHLEIRLTNAYTRTATTRTYIGFLSGLPKPAAGAVAIAGVKASSSTVTAGVTGYINSNGAFYICNDDGVAFTSGDVYTFTGNYLTT